MDGVRLITIVEGDNVRFFSRTGNEFFTLDVLKNEILKFVKDNEHTNFVLDGEVCIVDENGNENFTDIIKQIRKKNYTIPNPKYKVFDLLTLIEFENQKGVIPFSNRYKSLKGLFGNLKYIDVLEQIKINVKEQLDDLTNIAREKNWEGLILRTNTQYEGKRTKKMLKVKDFNDAEYKVLDVIFGEIRYITENKKEVKEEMLSAITIDHKGSIVKVGSGFSIDERKKYYKNPELIIGKTITVKYFEESKDKNGNYSLRFPVVKAIYDKERTI
jgi:DNA ligase-1